MRKDKNTIINELVHSASYIMESKAEENMLIIEMLEQKCAEVADPDKLRTIDKLKELNTQIAAAVKLIRENGGCWS